MTSVWGSRDLAAVDAAEEIEVRTRRGDGSLRSPRVIWVVRVGDRVVVRSANGRGAQWFRWAVATGSGQLVVGGTAHDVTFTEVGDDATLGAADAAYRAKYGPRYAGIVRSLTGAGPRAATLVAEPA